MIQLVSGDLSDSSTCVGMYPLSGVMGDKHILDLLGPYEYVGDHL
jgi:hypothetical protein